MQAAAMLVIEPLLAAHEHFPDGPFFVHGNLLECFGLHMRRAASHRLLLRSPALLFAVGEGGFTDPCAVLMRLDPRSEAFLVAGTVAVDDAPELVPIDLAVVEM